MKTAWVRWLLDAILLIGIAAGGWMVGRINKISESDRVQSVQIQSMEKSMQGMVESVDKLADSIDKLADQQKALITIATFRTDPWSGAMMIAYHDFIQSILNDSGIDIHEPGMPAIRKIQKTYQEDLIPEFLKSD